MPAVQLRGQRDLDVVKLLDDKLTGAFHIPLNDTLQIYEYVGRDELAASCHIVREARYKIDETVARNAAAAVTADRWAVFVIENLEEYMRMSFSFDYNDILLSEVKLRLIVYDRERDVYNEYRGRAYYRDEYSPAGTAYALADDLADKLLKKADLKGGVFPLRQKYGGIE